MKKRSTNTLSLLFLTISNLWTSDILGMNELSLSQEALGEKNSFCQKQPPFSPKENRAPLSESGEAINKRRFILTAVHEELKSVVHKRQQTAQIHGAIQSELNGVLNQRTLQTSQEEVETQKKRLLSQAQESIKKLIPQSILNRCPTLKEYLFDHPQNNVIPLDIFYGIFPTEPRDPEEYVHSLARLGSTLINLSRLRDQQSSEPISSHTAIHQAFASDCFFLLAEYSSLKLMPLLEDISRLEPYRQMKMESHYALTMENLKKCLDTGASALAYYHWTLYRTQDDVQKNARLTKAKIFWDVYKPFIANYALHTPPIEDLVTSSPAFNEILKKIERRYSTAENSSPTALDVFQAYNAVYMRDDLDNQKTSFQWKDSHNAMTYGDLKTFVKTCLAEGQHRWVNQRPTNVKLKNASNTFGKKIDEWEAKLQKESEDTEAFES